MLIVRNLNRLSEAYIKNNLYKLTLGNKFRSEMKAVLETKPWLNNINNKHYAFVLKNNNEYIGWALYIIHNKSGNLNVYIKTNYRKKGNATLLLNKIKSFSKRNNIKKITVRSNNSINRRFFINNGFQTINGCKSKLYVKI
jgi:N-acetylglutamate synthase-like GNAT family acetyltransferase